MNRSTSRVVKDALNHRIGWQVIFEWRNKVLKWPGTLRMRRFENRQVRRLLTVGGPPSTATVAVVIPTYRRPDGLAVAVRSVLAQTWDDLVLVVVDDGGGLDTSVLPDDPRVRTASLSENSHVLGLVRNVGMRLSASRYVAFLDDDNSWEPDHLELSIRALTEDRKLSGVYTALRRVLPDGNELDILSVPFDRKRASWDSFLDCNAFVAHRSKALMFSRMPRPIGLLPREDWEMLYRYTRRHLVRHLPVPTVRYLVNPSSFYTQWDKDENKSGENKGDQNKLDQNKSKDRQPAGEGA